MPRIVPEDRVRKLLRKIGDSLPIYTVSYLRRLESSQTIFATYYETLWREKILLWNKNCDRYWKSPLYASTSI